MYEQVWNSRSLYQLTYCMYMGMPPPNRTITSELHMDPHPHLVLVVDVCAPNGQQRIDHL